MKCLIIGRHQATFPEGIEVIRQENINFPASANECRAMLEDLAADAEDEGIEAILFQAIPNQVAMAIPQATFFSLKVGAIVNKPGERLAGVKKFFHCNEITQRAPLDAQEMISRIFQEELSKAVLFANPRAKIALEGNSGGVEIEVDPPLRFEFSHIEWLQ